jgi:hypothetical protein
VRVHVDDVARQRAVVGEAQGGTEDHDVLPTLG